jgi:hypothetical protein
MRGPRLILGAWVLDQSALAVLSHPRTPHEDALSHVDAWMPCPIFRVRRYAIAALVEFCTPAAVRRVAHGRRWRWRWLLQRSSSFLGQKAENWLQKKGPPESSLPQ